MARSDNDILEAFSKLSSVIRLVIPEYVLNSPYSDITNGKLDALERKIQAYTESSSTSEKAKISGSIESVIQNMLIDILNFGLKEAIAETEECKRRYMIPKKTRDEVFSELLSLDNALKALKASDTKSHIDDIGQKINNAFTESRRIREEFGFFRLKSTFRLCTVALCVIIFLLTGFNGTGRFDILILGGAVGLINLVQTLWLREFPTNIKSIYDSVLLPVITSIIGGLIIEGLKVVF